MTTQRACNAIPMMQQVLETNAAANSVYRPVKAQPGILRLDWPPQDEVDSSSVVGQQPGP
jgi:hypothetical protein